MKALLKPLLVISLVSVLPENPFAQAESASKESSIDQGPDAKVAELARLYPARKNFSKVIDRQVEEALASLKISDPKQKSEITQNLNQGVQKKLDGVLAEAFGKTFSEKEIDYLLSLYRSSFGQRMNDLMNQANNRVVDNLRQHIKSEADRLTKLNPSPKPQ